MKRLIPLALLAAVLLAACASAPRMSDDERLALIRENAGEPVNSFRYVNRLRGWTALGDSALLVWPRSNQAFLLELNAPCPDLRFAFAISVSSRMSTVSARFDHVTPRSPGASPIRIPCRIHTIRPVDVKALRAAQQEIREASVVEREETTEDDGESEQDDGGELQD